MEKNEKNKILEDILNQTNQKQSKSSVSGKRYEQHILRKNVNPAALNRSSDVNSVSVQKEYKKDSTYHTGSIYQNSNNEIENNQYREYTVNIRRPVGLADDTNNTSQNQINSTSETEKKKTNFDNKSIKNKKTKKKKKISTSAISSHAYNIYFYCGYMSFNFNYCSRQRHACYWQG
ncbi:MAG: hypothetical protein V8T22_10530 [Oscillospiraceae bacterium]